MRYAGLRCLNARLLTLVRQSTTLFQTHHGRTAVNPSRHTACVVVRCTLCSALEASAGVPRTGQDGQLFLSSGDPLHIQGHASG